MGLPDDEDVMNDITVPAENNARTSHTHGKFFFSLRQSVRFLFIYCEDVIFYFYMYVLYSSTVPSEKTFFKELGKVIEASDVILEVLDARDPIGTRCADMEKMAMKSDPNKRIVLLLNKIGKVYLFNIFIKMMNESETIFLN